MSKMCSVIAVSRGVPSLEKLWFLVKTRDEVRMTRKYIMRQLFWQRYFRLPASSFNEAGGRVVGLY